MTQRAQVALIFRKQGLNLCHFILFFFFFCLCRVLVVALGYLFAAYELLLAACGIVLDQGSNPSPLHWGYRVLATGPPGKSLSFHS